MMIERLKAEGVIDVFQTVQAMRLQRPAMVQTAVRGWFLATPFVKLTVPSISRQVNVHNKTLPFNAFEQMVRNRRRSPMYVIFIVIFDSLNLTKEV